jgi:putative transposon-encoded protein
MLEKTVANNGNAGGLMKHAGKKVLLIVLRLKSMEGKP